MVGKVPTSANKASTALTRSEPISSIARASLSEPFSSIALARASWVVPPRPRAATDADAPRGSSLSSLS